MKKTPVAPKPGKAFNVVETMYRGAHFLYGYTTVYRDEGDTKARLHEDLKTRGVKLSWAGVRSIFHSELAKYLDENKEVPRSVAAIYCERAETVIDKHVERMDAGGTSVDARVDSKGKVYFHMIDVDRIRKYILQQQDATNESRSSKGRVQQARREWDKAMTLAEARKKPLGCGFDNAGVIKKVLLFKNSAAAKKGVEVLSAAGIDARLMTLVTALEQPWDSVENLVPYRETYLRLWASEHLRLRVRLKSEEDFAQRNFIEADLSFLEAERGRVDRGAAMTLAHEESRRMDSSMPAPRVQPRILCPKCGRIHSKRAGCRL
jgi:hypothetical protein